VPKMKTHRGAAKRFRLSGSGKLMRRKSFRAHILEKKSPCRKMRLAKPAEVHSTDRPRLARALGVKSRVQRKPNPGPQKKEG